MSSVKFHSERDLTLIKKALTSDNSMKVKVALLHLKNMLEKSKFYVILIGLRFWVVWRERLASYGDIWVSICGNIEVLKGSG